MTQQQREWMTAHPAFKAWAPQGPVSIYSWADVGWLMPNGTFVADGEHHHWGGTHMMSSGDTLYTSLKGASKIGRECMMV